MPVSARIRAVAAAVDGIENRRTAYNMPPIDHRVYGVRHVILAGGSLHVTQHRSPAAGILTRTAVSELLAGRFIPSSTRKVVRMSSSKRRGAGLATVVS